MSLPARIDVFDFAARGQSLAGAAAVAELPRLMLSLREPAGDLEYRYQGQTDAQRRPAGRLSLHGRVLLTCDRCNQALAHELGGESSFFFVHDEDELQALPLDPEADSEPLLGSRSFDLAALLEDEAILALPMSPRHAQCPNTAGDAAATPTGRVQAFAELARLKRKG
jgi:uncharacterized protein